MPRFMAQHTVPLTEEQAMGLLDNPRLFTEGVTWKLTYCDFDSGKFFCEWEAPSKEAIEAVFKSVQMPYDAIYPVRLLDVSRRQIEPKAEAAVR